MRPVHAAVLAVLAFLAAAGIALESARRSSFVLPQPARESAVEIDVNCATLDDLLSLPEIGPALARRILEHRRRHGPFKTVDALIAVKGIGPKTLDRLKRRLKVGTSPDDH